MSNGEGSTTQAPSAQVIPLPARNDRPKFVPIPKSAFLRAIRDADGSTARAAKLLGITTFRMRSAMQRWPELVDEAERSFKQLDNQRYEIAESIKTTALKSAARKAQKVEEALRNDPTAEPKFALTTTERVMTIDALKDSDAGRRRYPKSETQVTVATQVNLQAAANLSTEQIRSLTDEELDRLIDGDSRVLARFRNP